MTFEVRRILKAFVDAQWLAEFDTRLAEYRARLEHDEDGAGGGSRDRDRVRAAKAREPDDDRPRTDNGGNRDGD